MGFQTANPRFFTNETFPLGYRLSLGGGFSNPVRNFLDQGRDTRNVDIMDHISWVKGNHTIKVGGGVRLTKVDQFNDSGIVPTYYLGFGPGNPDPLVPDLFPGGISSGELSSASGLLGTLGGFVDEADQVFNVLSPHSGYVDGGSNTNILTQNFVNFYVGDTWRVTSCLSLNFGVRWEFHSVPDEAQGLGPVARGRRRIGAGSRGCH